MKTLLLSIFSCILSTSLISQNSGFHFQAQARDREGEVMENQSINIAVKIYEENELIYQEKHQRETTNYGFLNFIVGEGMPTEGSFSNIDWSSINHQVEISMNDEVLDRVPLQAVPYAKHANTADHIVNFSMNMIEDIEVTNAVDGDLLGYDGSTWVPVVDGVDDADADPINEIQQLQLFGNQLQLSKNGGAIELPDAELIFPYSYTGLHDDQVLAIVNDGWNGIYGGADKGWGVRGHSKNNFGVAGSGLQGGVYGYSKDGQALSAYSNNGFGVHADGGIGTGVYGKGKTYGIQAVSDAIAVSGQGDSKGVEGLSEDGLGVFGKSTNGTGIYGVGKLNGVYGYALDGKGVKGSSWNDFGVFGSSVSSAGVVGQGKTKGVHGKALNGFGIYGESTNATGVYGFGKTEGLWGSSSNRGVYGSGTNVGVYGYSGSHVGVAGIGAEKGLYGSSNSGIGVAAVSPNGTALYVTGTSTMAYNSTVGNGQIKIYEQGNDYARITMRSTFNNNYWDVAALTANNTDDARLNFYCKGPGNILKLRGNGNAWLKGSLNQASDARLKMNINKLAPSSADLDKLNGYTYQFIDAPGVNQIGIIAQEVKNIYPQLVTENEDGFMAVNYSGLIPILIEAHKEQEEEIVTLKGMIAAIELRLARLDK